MKHPTPWETRTCNHHPYGDADDSAPQVAIFDADNEFVLYWERTEDYGEIFARIISAVNAHDNLTQQRDALLKAAKGVPELLGHTTTALAAAIALCKEKP